MVLWRVALLMLTAVGYLTRAYYAAPAYHLFNDLLSFPTLPLASMILTPSMLAVSDTLRSSLCTSRVPHLGESKLCAHPIILNYASFDLGARPVEDVSPFPPSPDVSQEGISDAISSSLSQWTGQKKVVSFPPTIVLQNTPSTLVHGVCWSMAAAAGKFAVTLARPIYITNITVSHFLSDSRAANEQAPRSIVVLGATASAELGDEVNSVIASTRLDVRSPLRDEMVHLLRPGEDLLPVGRISYDIDGAPTQWITPQQSFPWNRVKVSTVVLKIEGNWGSQRTCLHNLEVFGHL